MEKDLFLPIKTYFEQFGYICDGEVNDIDLYMEKEDESVAVELKQTLDFKALQQAALRQKITDIVYENKKEYVDNLSTYIKSSHVSDLTLTTKDNISYEFLGENMGTYTENNQERFASVWIRLKPDANKNGYDKFRFEFVTDGSLIPYGSTGIDGEDSSKPFGTNHWTTKCPADKKPSDPTYCAGHIFENNLKVLYK